MTQFTTFQEDPGVKKVDQHIETRKFIFETGGANNHTDNNKEF